MTRLTETCPFCEESFTEGGLVGHLRNAHYREPAVGAVVDLLGVLRHTRRARLEVERLELDSLDRLSGAPEGASEVRNHLSEIEAQAAEKLAQIGGEPVHGGEDG